MVPPEVRQVPQHLIYWASTGILEFQTGSVAAVQGQISHLKSAGWRLTMLEFITKCKIYSILLRDTALNTNWSAAHMCCLSGEESQYILRVCVRSIGEVRGNCCRRCINPISIRLPGYGATALSSAKTERAQRAVTHSSRKKGELIDRSSASLLFCGKHSKTIEANLWHYKLNAYQS